MEEILSELGKDVKLARDGNNNWSVKEGTAKIKINYNPDNYFVAGDAYLCQLPSDITQIKPLYQFLLQENYKLDSLVLSCVKQNIVLSCIMYDLDMTKEAGIEMFRDLFQKADHYDQLLEKEFGCLNCWKNKNSCKKNILPRNRRLQKLKTVLRVTRNEAIMKCKQKLWELGLYASDHDEIISTLIEEDYFNEERFAKQFAGGKFRMKDWGQRKDLLCPERKKG